MNLLTAVLVLLGRCTKNNGSNPVRSRGRSPCPSLLGRTIPESHVRRQPCCTLGPCCRQQYAWDMWETSPTSFAPSHVWFHSFQNLWFYIIFVLRFWRIKQIIYWHHYMSPSHCVSIFAILFIYQFLNRYIISCGFFSHSYRSTHVS